MDTLDIFIDISGIDYNYKARVKVNGKYYGVAAFIDLLKNTAEKYGGENFDAQLFFAEETLFINAGFEKYVLYTRNMLDSIRADSGSYAQPALFLASLCLNDSMYMVELYAKIVFPPSGSIEKLSLEDKEAVVERAEKYFPDMQKCLDSLEVKFNIEKSPKNLLKNKYIDENCKKAKDLYRKINETIKSFESERIKLEKNRKDSFYKKAAVILGAAPDIVSIKADEFASILARQFSMEQINKYINMVCYIIWECELKIITDSNKNIIPTIKKTLFYRDKIKGFSCIVILTPNAICFFDKNKWLGAVSITLEDGASPKIPKNIDKMFVFQNMICLESYGIGLVTERYFYKLVLTSEKTVVLREVPQRLTKKITSVAANDEYAYTLSRDYTGYKKYRLLSSGIYAVEPPLFSLIEKEVLCFLPEAAHKEICNKYNKERRISV